jgi:prephenate dehydratase
MKNNGNNMKNKIGLISNLHTLASLNRDIEETGNSKTRFLMRKQRSNQIKSTKKLVDYLNNIGKLSDKERISLYSLDLLSLKDLKKIKIGEVN